MGHQILYTVIKKNYTLKYEANYLCYFLLIIVRSVFSSIRSGEFVLAGVAEH